MKSRQYYASIADDRLEAEEARRQFYGEIQDVVRTFVTLYYCIMAMIAPKQKKDRLKYD